MGVSPFLGALLPEVGSFKKCIDKTLFWDFHKTSSMNCNVLITLGSTSVLQNLLPPLENAFLKNQTNTPGTNLSLGNLEYHKLVVYILFWIEGKSSSMF